MDELERKKERQRELRIKYYAEHREEILRKARERYKNMSESERKKHKDRCHKYYLEHPDEIKANAARWQALHPEKLLENRERRLEKAFGSSWRERFSKPLREEFEDMMRAEKEAMRRKEQEE